MVLLDTCAAIWLLEEQHMTAASVAAIKAAAIRERVLISPVTAWEIGFLASRPRRTLTFSPTPVAWFADLLARPGVRSTPLGHQVAIAAALLPGSFHRDPADRLLVATARELGTPLVTRDARILAYAAEGHVDAIAC